MKQNSVGQDIAEPGKADAQTEIQDVGTTTVPTNVVVPEHVATHPRYSAWCLDYQMKFDRQPFTTPELTEQDKSDFELWADSDSKATAMLEQTISKAMEHPLWKEYCVDAINNGAEGQLYNGGGLADVEDVEAEVEAWNDFLKKKEIAPEQDKSKTGDDTVAAASAASAVTSPSLASPAEEPHLRSKDDSQVPSSGPGISVPTSASVS